MILDFSRHGLAAVFEIAADKSVAFKHFSCNGVERDWEKKLPYCNVAELQITGGNTFDIHFAKHTGSWGSRNLRYVSHTYEPNALGDKLEIRLSNGTAEQNPDGGTPPLLLVFLGFLHFFFCCLELYLFPRFNSFYALIFTTLQGISQIQF